MKIKWFQNPAAGQCVTWGGDDVCLSVSCYFPCVLGSDVAPRLLVLQIPHPALSLWETPVALARFTLHQPINHRRSVFQKNHWQRANHKTAFRYVQIQWYLSSPAPAVQDGTTSDGLLPVDIEPQLTNPSGSIHLGMCSLQEIYQWIQNSSSSCDLLPQLGSGSLGGKGWAGPPDDKLLTVVPGGASWGLLQAEPPAWPGTPGRAIKS